MTYDLTLFVYSPSGLIMALSNVRPWEELTVIAYAGRNLNCVRLILISQGMCAGLCLTSAFPSVVDGGGQALELDVT